MNSDMSFYIKNANKGVFSLSDAKAKAEIESFNGGRRWKQQFVSVGTVGEFSKAPGLGLTAEVFVKANWIQRKLLGLGVKPKWLGLESKIDKACIAAKQAIAQRLPKEIEKKTHSLGQQVLGVASSAPLPFCVYSAQLAGRVAIKASFSRNDFIRAILNGEESSVLNGVDKEKDEFIIQLIKDAKVFKEKYLEGDEVIAGKKLRFSDQPGQAEFSSSRAGQILRYLVLEGEISDVYEGSHQEKGERMFLIDGLHENLADEEVNRVFTRASAVEKYGSKSVA